MPEGWLLEGHGGLIELINWRHYVWLLVEVLGFLSPLVVVGCEDSCEGTWCLI